MGFNWKKTVASVAPKIALALGTPVAGAAVSVLMGVLGVKEEKDIEAALKNASPETLAKIQEADHKFETDMAQIGVDLEKIASEDRDSARDREKSVGGLSNPILAGVVIVGFFAVVGYVLTNGFKGMSGEALVMSGSMAGYVSAKADQVISYYFGSSAGSKQKTALIGSIKARG